MVLVAAGTVASVGLMVAAAGTEPVVPVDREAARLVEAARAPSAPSRPLAPLAPSDLRADPRATSVGLTWTAPLVDATGRRAEQFELAVDPDGTDWVSLDATSEGGGRWTAVVGDLVAGEEVRVAVRAVEDDLDGVPATVEAAPVGPPGRVRDVRVAVRGGAVTLRWAAPRADGGAPVRRYVVTAPYGNGGCSTQRTSCTVRGVDLRRALRFAVRADNATAGLADSGLGPVARSRTLGPRR
ncbi:hypothetical protein GCM10028771_12720 [Nocardioides marmoraquaticus]